MLFWKDTIVAVLLPVFTPEHAPSCVLHHVLAPDICTHDIMVRGHSWPRCFVPCTKASLVIYNLSCTFLWPMFM